MTLQNCIAMLEAATGPDREIDLAINLAIEPDGGIAKLMKYRRGFDGKEGYAWDIGPNGWSVCFEKYDANGRCSHNGGFPLQPYTRSIDAALTLVPPGAEYEISTLYACATVSLPVNADDTFTVRREDGNVPLAISTAALQARAVEQHAPKSVCDGDR